MRIMLLFLFVCANRCYAQGITATLDSTVVRIDTLLESPEINAPWDIEMQGTDLWFTDATRIRRFNTNSQDLKTMFTQSNKYALGLTIHPDFLNFPYVFVVFSNDLYYSTSSGASVYRYEYSVALDSLMNETEIFQYQHSGEHAGGRMLIMPDLKLLLTTADYWFGQDCDTCTTELSKKGKILRLNLDGTIPSDNPFPNTYTYTRGHRNPQGLALTSLNQIYSTEHSQQTTANELNYIVPTENYGWPAYDGTDCWFLDSCNSPTYNPTFPQIDTLFPPSGLAFYASSAIPEFEGSLLGGILGFGNGFPEDFDVMTLNSTQDNVVSHKRYGIMQFGVNFGRIRDIAVSDDGKVYFICNDRKNLNYWSNPEVTSDAQIMCMSNSALLTQIKSRAQQQVRFYPNPVSQSLYFSSLDSPSVLRVYDVLGSLIFQATSDQGFMRVDHLKPGMYFIRVEDGQVASFVKE